MKATKKMRSIAALLTVIMLVTILPTAQISAAVEEARAQEEAFKAELAAYAEQYPDGAFAFYEANSEITEGEGDVAVRVVRLGDTSAQASVDLKAADGTAFYGDDYEVYFKEGFTKHCPEQVLAEESPEEPAADYTPDTDKNNDAGNENVSALRSAYAQQTGEEPVNINWRGEYEEYVAQLASIEAENEIINALDGWQLTLDFAPGEYAKTVYIHVNDDDRSEGDESAAFILGNATVGMLGEQLEHDLTVKDNEPAEKIIFAMKEAEIIVEPGSQYAEIPVTRISGMDYYAGAVLRTAEGTAKPYEDYTPADGERLSFAPGEEEAVLRVTLVDEMKKGRYFTVRLDSDNVNIADGKAETTVWLGKKGTKNDDSLNEFGFPKVSGASALSKNDGIASTGADRDIAKVGSEPTCDITEGYYDGLLCDIYTYYPDDYSVQNENGTLSFAKSISDDCSSFVNIHTRMTGDLRSGDYLRGNLSLTNNPDQWITVTADSDGAVTKEQSFGFADASDNHDRAMMSSRETFSFNLTLYSGYTASSKSCEFAVTSYETYHPRFTLELIDANPQMDGYTGKTYTSPDAYTEFTFSALTADPTWSTQTVSYDNRVTIDPGPLKGGVYVDHYEFYIDGSDTSLASLKSHYKISNDTVDYAWLCENIVNSQYTNSFGSTWYYGCRYSDIKNANFTIKVKPVYKAVTANLTVSFLSQDNDKVKFNDFGDTLTCSLIDRIQFTASSADNSEFIPSVVNYYSQRENGPSYENSAGDRSFSKIVDLGVVTYDGQGVTLEVCYKNPSLTIEYHPDEVTAGNAGVGAVGLSTLDTPDDTLGYSDYQTPFTLNYDLEGMKKTYLAQVIPGEGFGDHEITVGGNTVPSSTKTIWTYSDNSGQNVSVYGNSFVFQPYHAYDDFKYFFQEVQRDVNPVGVTGTVSTVEIPIFSSSTDKITNPAVGVQMNVGGIAATTGSDGTYTIPAQFNKAEYVAAYLKYDTLARASQIAMSDNKVQDFSLDVNTDDGILVDTSLSKVTKDVPSLDDDGKPQRDSDNNIIYNETSVVGITKEDISYHMYVYATGSTAAITPTTAEFRVYDKSGVLKQDLTKTVNFVQADDKYVAELVFNPSAEGFEVGDSFTVKCYDQDSVGYYEHQTDKSMIVAEKLSGLYLFNYQGVQKQGDSTLIKLLGGVALGLNTGLDVVSDEYGQYYDADSKQTHDMFCVGATLKYKPQKSSGSFQFTSAEDAYKSMQELKKNFSSMRDGSYSPSLPTRDDHITTFGSSGNPFAISISLCLIMDAVLETDDPDHKGEYKFGDFFIVGNATVDYNKTWTVSVGPLDLTFNLSFTVGKESNGAISGVRWHFYNDSNTPYYISSGNTIDLLSSGDLANEGDLAISAVVKGSVKATALKGLAGVEGDLDIGLDHSSYYNKTDGWQNKGVVSLKPKVRIKILLFWIDVWTQEWVFNYGDDNSLAPTGEAMEEVLFTSTKGRTLAMPSANNSLGQPMLGESEAIISDITADHSNAKVQNLGNGKYLAVWLDNVPGRSAVNSLGAYYSIFDGSAWSSPELLEDDGTVDQLPTICEAGSKGFLIVWSDASREHDKDENLTDALNTLNLSGRFFNADTEELGEVMEITKSTEGDMETSDTDPSISYYQEDGNEYLKLYYTKSEYSISDETQGEVMGDVLNPYQVIVVRNYDFENDKWRDDYIGNAKKKVLDSVGAENYDAYVAQWYGQEFLDLTPDVSVNETLNENGYWAEGTAAELTEEDNSQTVVKDGDSIATDHLSLYAYALDKGGMAQTTGDQNLYLHIYDFEEDIYHHPICISAKQTEINDISFVRIPVYDGDDPTEMIYLYWLEDGIVKRINVSSLISNNLVETTTSAGKKVMYVDKTNNGVANSYAPAQNIVSGYSKNADDIINGVGSFSVYQKGDYNYTVWTQFLQDDDDENHELHLFARRENTRTGESTYPVQITDADNLYVNCFDCIALENGDLDIFAECMALGGDGKPDYSTGVLKSIRISADDELVVDSANMVNETYTKEGDPAVQIQVVIRNGGLNPANSVKTLLKDADGNVIASTDDPYVSYETTKTVLEDGRTLLEVTPVEKQAPVIKLIGGAKTIQKFTLPIKQDGSYSGTLTVYNGEKEGETKQISGKITPAYQASELKAEVTERDHVHLTGTVRNTSVLNGNEQNAIYGYIDKDGNKTPLGTVPMGALAARGSYSVDVDTAIDFSKFTETTDEDGSVVSSMEFYLSTNADVTTDDTVTVKLAVTAEEASLMNILKEKELSAQPGSFNKDCSIHLSDTLLVGEKSTLRLTVDGKAAYNIPEYVNRTKIIWTAAENDVAAVSSDGIVTAKSSGTITVTGLLMPCDTHKILYKNGNVVDVNNYVTLPASMIIPVTATITVSELLGDVDGDNEVSILDATYIQRWLASLPVPSFSEAAADTDEDNEVSIIDATYIQRWLVSLPSNDKIGKPL